MNNTMEGWGALSVSAPTPQTRAQQLANPRGHGEL